MWAKRSNGNIQNTFVEVTPAKNVLHAELFDFPRESSRNDFVCVKLFTTRGHSESSNAVTFCYAIKQFKKFSFVILLQVLLLHGKK